MSLYESLIQHFNIEETTESSSLAALRTNAFDIFKANNFPTVKNEEWRFTNIQPYVSESYNTALAESADPQKVQQGIKDLSISHLEAYRLVIVNGNIDYTHSQLPSHDKFFIHLTKDMLSDENFVKKINHQLPIDKFPFAALNTAFFKSGYFFDVKKGCYLDKPIEIMHIYSGETDTIVQPRNIIYLENDSQAEIIESFICLDDYKYFVNSVTEIHVESNARCSHAIFQKNKKGQRFVKHVQVTQQQDSHYDNYTITIPEADIVRNNLNVVLDGKNTETHMYGLYLVGDGQLVDNHSLVDHRHPNCESNQLYKGVILEGGKGVFNGKIHVHRPAQKTNAFQQNNNLLFGTNAQINTKPQLEIFADDVKCSHGSTIGQFNKESLFYLQTRGIGEETARTMMVNAFAFDVTQKLQNEPLRNYINHLIEETIAKAK